MDLEESQVNNDEVLGVAVAWDSDYRGVYLYVQPGVGMFNL